MSGGEPFRLGQTVVCHAWSPNGDRVAVSPNDHTIQIYSYSGGKYTLQTTLAEHDQLVTGLDWGKSTNRLLSCAQDRNAYVWTETPEGWKPVLVILRINRAATWCKWSPQENKFAVSCGQKLVSVCYFEEDNDWWVSKHIKKHRSTVLKVDWHPGNSLIATASSDCMARVFSAHIKGVDKGRPETPFGGKLPFGECVAEIEGSKGWVQSVKWSPSGNYLAFVGQDSSIHFGDISSGSVTTQTIHFAGLPLRDLIFIRDDAVIAAGNDRTPKLFEWKGSEWAFIKDIDDGKKATGPAKTSAAGAARSIFQSKVDRGQAAASSETTLGTKHQNAITCITAVAESGGNVSQYSTTGVDGNIIIWKA